MLYSSFDTYFFLNETFDGMFSQLTFVACQLQHVKSMHIIRLLTRYFKTSFTLGRPTSSSIMHYWFCKLFVSGQQQTTKLTSFPYVKFLSIREEMYYLALNSRRSNVETMRKGCLVRWYKTLKGLDKTLVFNAMGMTTGCCYCQLDTRDQMHITPCRFTTKTVYAQRQKYHTFGKSHVTLNRRALA